MTDPAQAIRDEIERLEDDPKMEGESAHVETNAVLALQQTDMEGRIKGLKFALQKIEDDE